MNALSVQDHGVAWAVTPFSLVLNIQFEGPSVEGLRADIDAALPNRIGPDVLEAIVDDLDRIEVDNSRTSKSHFFETGKQRLLKSAGLFCFGHDRAEFGDGDFQRLVLEVESECREDCQNDGLVRERGFDKSRQSPNARLNAGDLEHVRKL